MDPERAAAAQHHPDRLLVFQPGGRGVPLCIRGPPARPGLYRRTIAWTDGLHAQSVADPAGKTDWSTPAHGMMHETLVVMPSVCHDLARSSALAGIALWVGDYRATAAACGSIQP